MTKKTKITKWLSKWSDEEVLENFFQMMDRVEISCQFIETEEGMITHQIIFAQCGDKLIATDPIHLEWPLQQMPMPEALKGSLN